PWFDLLSEVFIFVSFAAIAYVLTKLYGNRLGTLAFVIVASFIAPQALIRVQFTKTSGVVAATALSLMAYSAFSDRRRRDLILGIILASYAFCLRRSEFLAVGVLMFPAFVLFFLQGNEGDHRYLFSAPRKKLLSGVIIMAAFAGVLFFADRMAYNADPVWKDYSRWNYARSELFDYGFPDFEENREELETLGIKESAWKLLRSYNYADPEVFTLDVFEGIVALKGEKRKFSGTVVKEFLREVPGGLMKMSGFYMSLIFFSFFLVYGRKRVLPWISVAGTLMLYGALYLYLFMTGRYLLERVDMGLFLGMSMSFLLSGAGELGGAATGTGTGTGSGTETGSGTGTETGSVTETGSDTGSNAGAAAETAAGSDRGGDLRDIDLRTAVFAGCMVLVLCQNFTKDYWRGNTRDNKGISAGQTEKFMEMSADREHLYLCKMAYPNVQNAFEPFDIMPKDIFGNIYFLGGWQVFEPETLKPLENYGVKNPYRDILTNEKILIVDDDIDLTMEYIHDYYDAGAQAVPAGMIGNEYQVYRIEGSS
ncbi:MAG: hypothetical protein K6E33_05885, partial [Lachnospiraceae bacterium]|nr:hypothetical protein [Lachnospiraceae bacterium]